jgi:hypothetical protein
VPLLCRNVLIYVKHFTPAGCHQFQDSRYSGLFNRRLIDCENYVICGCRVDIFDVHGSVLLGNVCICSIEIPTRCTRFCMYSFFLYIFALHVSGYICTHPQEHKLQSTALGVCNGCAMLVHWAFSTVKFGLDRAKSVRVSQPVPSVW